jgi:hypothetical protein
VKPVSSAAADARVVARMPTLRQCPLGGAENDARVEENEWQEGSEYHLDR